jgi:hypothetical protein
MSKMMICNKAKVCKHKNCPNYYPHKNDDICPQEIICVEDILAKCIPVKKAVKK